MKRIISGALALSLLVGTSAAAFADPYHPYPPQSNYSQGHNDYDHGNSDRYDHVGYGHDTHVRYTRVTYWRPGQRIDSYDWNRGRVVDYHVYHLRPPARGYEWREINGQFVEAAIVGGLVATAVVALSR